MTSRGAIQHRIPTPSSAAQTALATGRLLVECEMNTSCAIARVLLPARRARSYFFAGMYFQFLDLPSASHFIVFATLSSRVCSRFASVIHSRYSRRWLGGKFSKVFRAFAFFFKAAAK